MTILNRTVPVQLLFAVVEVPTLLEYDPYDLEIASVAGKVLFENL